MNPDLLFAEAFRLQQRGALGEAEAVYRQLLALRPALSDARLNLGAVLAAAGRPEEAATEFQEVVRLNPREVRGWTNLGVALRKAGDPEGAAAAYEQAGRLNPDSAPLHLNLGNLWLQLGQPAQALDHFQRLPALLPDRPSAWLGIATALDDLGRTEEAFAFLDQVLEKAPGLPEYLLNRGVLCLSLNRPLEAEAALRAALARDPSMAEAEYALGLARLLQGDLGGGFAGYEARWRRNNPPQPPPRSEAPRWRGEPLAGRTLLVHAEQGMGDLIQMAQLLRRIEGGTVLFQVWPPLVRLFEGLAGATRILSAEQPLPPHDCIIPALSLPLALGLKLEDLGGLEPYLHADPDAVEAVRRSLPEGSGAWTGLCWRGRPEHANDRRRSLLPSLLRPLLELPSLRWASLQKDGRAEELAVLGGPLDLGSGFQDFAEAAAAVAALDRVVTVDTAIAHLAGALGKPTLLLLPFAPDPRWMLDREDSPWYPSLRLVRQPTPGAWGPVVARVGEILSAAPGAL